MIYLDDGFFGHRKVLAAGDDAAILYLKLMGWLKQQRSRDGRFPAYVVPHYAPVVGGRQLDVEPLVERLVATQMWERDGDEFVCHNYVERNAKALRKSEQARQAARKRHADADADAVRTQAQEPESGSGRSADGDAEPMRSGHATSHGPQPTVHGPPDVDKSSSSPPLLGAEEEAATPTALGAMGVIVIASRRHADAALDAQPSGSVRLPEQWKAKAAETWRLEHVDRCVDLLIDHPDMTAGELLRKIDGGTSLPGYRLAAVVEHPVIDEDEKRKGRAVIDTVRATLPTNREAESA